MANKLQMIFFMILLMFLFSIFYAFGYSQSIISKPITSAKVGIFYRYDVDVADDNVEDLIYSLIEKPDGMVINASTGIVSWTPKKEQIGENKVVVQLFNGEQYFNQSFSIIVDKANLISIEVFPSEINVEINRTKTIESVFAYYDNGKKVKIAINNCTFESDASDIATINSDGIITGKSVFLVYEASHPDENVNLPMLATITVSYTEDDITKSDNVFVLVYPKPDCG